MARRSTISISKEEKQLLRETTEELYGSTDVPWGVTIARLCEQVLAEENDGTTMK